MDPHFELDFAPGLHALEVRRFTIHEAMSTPYVVELLLRSPEQSIPLEPFLNEKASLTIKSGVAHLTTKERTWTGVASHMEQIRSETPAAGKKPLSTYYMRIVPKLWLLSQKSDTRIFQRKTLIEIVDAVLGEHGVTAAKKLKGNYRKLDYVVQYAESDLAFVSRLLEDWGVSYYFDYAAGGVLTLDDHPEDVGPRGPLRFNDSPSQSAEKEFVTHLRIGHRVRPGKVVERDFDFRRKHDYPLFGKSPVSPPREDFYELYGYRPGVMLAIDASDGDGSTPVADDKGKVRSVEAKGHEHAERAHASARRPKRFVAFRTNCVDLAPGTTLTVDGHPRDDVGKKILVTDFSLDGTPGGEWVHEAEAVFADVPHAPARRTPRPVIHGTQTAVVVGPPGQEIWTDEFGRVRVQFAWDRQGKKDDNSSCWIRVSQSWAGRGYGTIMIPRVGQEVLVSFFEGDPDQPVIVGRVYNAVRTMPKEALTPKYQTRSTWMSDTSDHVDASFNEIRYEDEKEKEFIYVQAQRDLQKLVKRNETERTGQNRATVIGGNRSTIVARIDATMVGTKYSLQMMEEPSPSDLKILEMQKPDVKPAPTKIELVDAKILVTSGKATSTFEGRDITFEAKGQITFKAGGDIVVSGGSDIKINC